MANKVASKRWIYSNFSVGSSSNECATKTEILGFGLYITNDSSYASNQLVREEDIYLPSWSYSFSVSDWDKKIGEYGGTTSSISISSTKSRLGETESVGWSIDNSTVPSWITWNSSSMTFTVSSNSSTSSRTADIYFEQDESGNRDYARVTQAEATPPADTYVFTWEGGSTSDVSASFPWNFSANGAAAANIPVVSTKNGSSQSWSVSSKPSWITTSTTSSRVTIRASDNSGSARSGTIVLTQSGSNKTLRINVTQAGHTQVTTYNYVFWTSTSGGTSTSGSFGQSGSSIQPQIYSYRETIVDGTVTSRDAISFSYTDKPSWITGEAVSTGYNPPNSPTYYAKMTASENTSVDARSYDVVITQSGSDKEITISVSQPGKANEYTFEIRKSDEEYTGKTSITFDVPASTVGWSGNYAYRSRKNGEQFANVSFSSSASWLHVESSGAYTVYHNTGSSSRSGTITLTQAESGLKCYVYINQSGYTPTYTFNVSPTNLSVTAAETNETLTVNSYKTVLESDGSETTESLDYEFSSDASWVNAARTTTNTTYITIAENLMVAKRNAKITLTQAESGAQAFTNVTQAGKVQSYNKLTITSVTYEDAYLFPPGITPVVGPEVYLKFLLPNTFTWETSSGLDMNKGTAYAGDRCNIYVFENSRYKLVKSFELKTGTQTVII